MPLDIKILQDVGNPESGPFVVKLDGSLDTATAPELERLLGPVLAGESRDLVFDLERLKFVSSAGLRVFAVARRRLKERGGQTAFVHLQPQIREVFEIIKALPGVAIFKDIQELDDYLAARQNLHQERR